MFTWCIVSAQTNRIYWLTLVTMENEAMDDKTSLELIEPAAEMIE